MRRPRPRTLLAAGAIALLAALVAAARRLDRSIDARVEDLLAVATPPDPAVVTAADLDALPAPVRRYLETALAADQPAIESVRLTQRGTLRLGGSWRPFEATQHCTVSPPGFLWDATVAVLPLVPARAVDAYAFGAGSLSARLASLVPVATVGSTPEMNEGELLRYLAEAVWYPTALVAAPVEWTPIDDRSARATIEHRGTSASLVFAFDDDDLVEAVRTEERYRQETDEFAPWTGTFDDYRERSGLRVPHAATVAWVGPEGDEPYWRGTVESIDHAFVD